MKKIIIFFVAIIVLVSFYYIGSGFTKISNVYIDNYRINSDGTEMTINISLSSSAGYVRKVVPHQQEGGKLYLDCYCAFGGINGSVGSKSEYTIPLDDDTEIIAIYRNTNCYEEVLKKNSEGDWQRVK